MLVTRARTERPHGALLQFGTGAWYCIVHVGTTAARSLLNGLVDRGYLRAEGENRGRKYYLAAKRPR